MHSNHLAFRRPKPWGVSGIWLLTWKSFSCQTNPFPCTFLCESVSAVPGGRREVAGPCLHRPGRARPLWPFLS